jgi:hypothetical protein
MWKEAKQKKKKRHNNQFQKNKCWRIKLNWKEINLRKDQSQSHKKT